jgi:uncharacterized protein (TIGR03435 family)
MTGVSRIILAAVFTGDAAWGQGPVAAPAFEVASIKPSPPPDGRGSTVGCHGGPGKPDPVRWSCTNMSLSSLLTLGYGLKRYELSGPAWMDDARFDVNATLPAGAGKDEFQRMVQNLVAERFKVVTRHEQKEMSMFEIVVAKNGPKLNEAAAEPPQDEAAGDVGPRGSGGPPKLGPDGYPALGHAVTMAWIKGKARWQNPRCTIQQFANVISGQLSMPVVDATGLKGTYDMTLYWAAESRNPSNDSDPAPTIYRAIQEQLGLKLEPKKGLVDILVVDRAEKQPTEN